MMCTNVFQWEETVDNELFTNKIFVHHFLFQNRQLLEKNIVIKVSLAA